MKNPLISLVPLALVVLGGACSAENTADDGGAGSSSTSGGTTGSGGSSSVGGTTGGSSSGGTGSGGDSASGGQTGGPIPCEDLPICEDFEGGLDAWTLRTEGGAVVLEHDAERGGQVIKTSGQVAYIETTSVFPAPEDKIYIRTFMKLGEAVPDNHVGYIALGGDLSESNDIRFGGQAGYLHFNLAQGDGLAPNPFTWPSCEECYSPPVNQWLCVEILFDWGNEVASFWIDGEHIYTADEASDYHAASTWPSTGASLRIGERMWGGGNTVWYDDVAVSYQPIGCP